MFSIITLKSPYSSVCLIFSIFFTTFSFFPVLNCLFVFMFVYICVLIIYFYMFKVTFYLFIVIRVYYNLQQNKILY